MISLFKKDSHTEYKDKILNSFPKALKKDVEEVLAILPFDEKNITLCDGQIHKMDSLIHPKALLTVRLNNELLTIPSRIYFNEPDIEKENKLTDIQKAILNCIYLRHHNGYLRQRRLEKLLDRNDYFIIPFTLQFLGEYVFEILEVLNKHIIENNIDLYRNFINENPKYWQQTKSRMISYWNEYYRRNFPKLRNYLGQEIVKRIGKVSA